MEKLPKEYSTTIFYTKVNDIIDRLNAIEARLSALNNEQPKNIGFEMTMPGASFFDEEG